ncbi:MAG: ribbon-helix-helix domain-containing protein [Rhizorhabdus sp.]
MSRFANLKDRPATAQPSVESIAAPEPREGTKTSAAASRAGRKAISGYFSPEMSFAMHMVARRQNRSLQDVMAEAFNDLLRKYGESPVGE